MIIYFTIRHEKADLITTEIKRYFEKKNGKLAFIV